MKKFLLFAMILTAIILSGCGASQSDDKQTIKIGTLTQLNTTPEQATKLISGGELNFFDNFNSMQMALSSGNINVIQTYGSVAKYMAAQNSELKISESQTVPLVDNFCCAMREDDTALKNSFDTAIAAMKSDGTLDALVDKYVTHFADNTVPVDIAKIDGAETIEVGITGDLPMLDYVLPDGKPAGFNTAVLSEISKRIGKNIELVQIESAARAAALTSGQVDVVFWVVVPADESNRPKDFDVPAGVAVTDPYYQDIVVNVNLSSLDIDF
ncbi:MAG: transporter substrate-binding domain-containing protein [Selenomonadaceae bacterium]|nr:transporter substrate-binding domain-containing protein [Selenomonadaceae bacterium]MBQ7492935.1 transporter substrate-binding domain-containing protein [Selenomonadaceae bacterium]